MRGFLLTILGLIWSVKGLAAFDLSAWHPEEGMHTIDGPWDMYWGELLTPEDFQQGRVTKTPVEFSIPGLWNKAEVAGKKLKANHFATYRSTFQLPDIAVQNRMPLTLELMSPPGASQIWVDGRLALQFGQVGRNAKSEVPANGRRFYTFVPDKNSIEIIMQVSSFHHRDGGTWWPMKIGAADRVATIHAAMVGLDAFAMSSLFIMIFYHLGIWLMRRQYHPPLAFAIFCTIIAVRASVTGLGDLHLLVYPDMPYRLQKVLEYGGFYLALPSFYSFAHALYPLDLKTWKHRGLWIVGLIFTATTVLLPSRIFTNFIEIYQIVTLLAILVFCRHMWSTIKLKRDGVGLFLLGTGILIFATANDILHAHRMAPIPTMIFSYGLFLMILCQAILLARRFTNAFNSVELSEKKIQTLNAELQNQNAVLDQLVEEKTRDIRSIMKNIKQGIFTVINDGSHIGAEFSDHLRLLIGAPNLKGGESFERILENAELSGDQRAQVSTVLSSVTAEPAFAFDVNSHLLPREVRLTLGIDQRLLEVDWIAIENEHTGYIEKVLVSLRDVTDLRLLQEEARRNQEELKLIGEVLDVPREKFDGIIQSCERLVKECLAQLSHASVDAHSMFRNMHTIKGVARSYGLSRLADAAHECEEIYAQLRDGQPISAAELLDAGQSVELLLQRYNQLHRQKLGRKGHDSDVLMIDRALITERMTNLRALDLSQASGEVRKQVQQLSQLFMNVVAMPLPRLLEQLIQDLPRLAEELGKENPELVFHDPGISIHPDSYDLLQNIFTHVLRNALDHGLETPAERQKRGKATQGSIVVDMRLNEVNFEIFVVDDGRGLDLAAIRQKAQQRGLIASQAILSDYETANLIFAPGLSTKDAVTAVSGRGVGLDAVKNFITQHHGRIEILLNPQTAAESGVPFCFHITLPASVCEGIMAVA